MMFWIVLDVCILPKIWAVLSSSQKQGQEKQVFTKNNFHSSVREHTMLTTPLEAGAFWKLLIGSWGFLDVISYLQKVKAL